MTNLEAENSPVGANGLIFLPYLLGERSPRWNPRARGVFIGLTIRQTRADMIRTVSEVVTINLRVILYAFRSHGAQIEAMRLIGGRWWGLLEPDVGKLRGIPLHRLAILDEATSMGAALAGGVCVGLCPDFSKIDTMNQVTEIIDPDAFAQAAYDQIYPRPEVAYRALVPLCDVMAETS